MAGEATEPHFLRNLNIWLPILTMTLPIMAAIVGGLWTVHVYMENQAAALARAEKEAVQQRDLREFEAQRPFLEKQLKLYFETAQLVGTLVTAAPNESTKWSDWETRFWQLYWSELSMVESRNVESAMRRLGGVLSRYTSDPQPEVRQVLQVCAYELAHEIRDSIAERWRVADGGERGSEGYNCPEPSDNFKGKDMK